MRALALTGLLVAVAVLAPDVAVVLSLLLAFWVRATWGRA